MHLCPRCVLAALASLAIVNAPRHSQAQNAPAPAPAQAKPATAPATPAANVTQPLATVNSEVITRGELLNFLSRYQIPVGNEEQAYQDAMETLVNTHLVNQYLTRQRIPVSVRSELFSPRLNRRP